MASRYNSYDSDLSSSKSNKASSCKAILRSKTDNPGNLTCMMKKLMEMNPKSKRADLLIPEEALKTVRGGGKSTTLGTLQRKLFGKDKVRALTEVKGNTRTLSMLLRSERELLSTNKDQEVQIADLKLHLQDKNTEVEKLKDLCLKQREEIKSLKSALLFPDETQEARQIIPDLQKQVISLNGQLQCIAQDLAQVKANNYLSERQAQTSSYDSLEFSSGSPDGLDLAPLEDLNPCLTPYTKTKPKQFERNSAEESLSGRSTVTTRGGGGGKIRSSSKSVKLSEGKAVQRSEESKGWHRGGRMF